MTERFTTDDLRIERLRPLLPPAILLEELPVSDYASQVISAARNEATSIMKGLSDRLLVVVGPCSVHDTAAAMDYGRRLRVVAEELASELLLVMRVYFEKPRTTVGWKGLINDPHLDGSFDINQGLRAARLLLLRLAEIGVPAGTEFLDTISPQFIADLVSWGAIGARTTESQVHRELASGLSMPVGFKNTTEGNVRLAIDAVLAAAHPHHFLSVTKQGVSAIVETRGNSACHVILRGGSKGPNFGAEAVSSIVEDLRSAGLQPSLMVDCSHGNSQKDHRRQLDVVADLCEQLGSGSRDIFGVMLESHLVEGRQDYHPRQPMVYGQSITDACLGWEQTEAALHSLAEAAGRRRARRT